MKNPNSVFNVNAHVLLNKEGIKCFSTKFEVLADLTVIES